MKTSRAMKLVLTVTFAAAALFFLSCMGATFLVQIPVTLAFGWVSFLARVVPQVRPDALTVLTAILCFTFGTFGVHVLASWLYPALQRDYALKWKPRWTGFLVLLVVMMFLAGTAMVGIIHQSGWILRSKEPMITSRRDAGQRAGSTNNLKQMGIAIHDHHDHLGVLPHVISSTSGAPLHSWQTAILPYTEQDGLHKKLNFSLPWNHFDNKPALTTQIRNYTFPGINDATTSGGYAVTHYAANALTFGNDERRRLNDYPHGISNTMIVGEAVRHPAAWGDPRHFASPLMPPEHPHGFNSPRAGGSVTFLMADGSARYFKHNEWHKLQFTQQFTE